MKAPNEKPSIHPARKRPSWFAPAILLAGLAMAACSAGATGQPVAHAPMKKTTIASPAAATDALGPRPVLGSPKPFEPPHVDAFKTANGMTVWLVERRALPMVSVMLAIPAGSAADPPGRAGLAHITADMLDEGAGSRSAVEVSSAIQDLGARLSIGVIPDGSYVSLTVLKADFSQAFSIVADIVTRPRFEPKEWKRVSELWHNSLRKRADDPAAVSRVVTQAVLYGPGTPYGHPSDGLLAGARGIDLKAVRDFYGQSWRPDNAVLVVAGDITKNELTREISASLASWAPSRPGSGSATPAPAGHEKARPSRERPRVVFVDRPDAPQSVIAVVREGVSVHEPIAPMLDLINAALGGSFTSRLNQNLREDHGWTYGARSAFIEARHQGAFIARAAVAKAATGPALQEMLAELDKMAQKGLTPDELAKVRAQDRAELVQTYQTVSGTSRRLGTLAMLGLAPSFDLDASRSRQNSSLERLAELARTHVHPESATVVVVGPRAEVAAQIEAIGLRDLQLWDPEGMPITGRGGSVQAKRIR